MRLSRLFPCALFALLLAGCSGSLLGWLPGRGPTPFPPIGDPEVRHGTLENGLTYFIRANDEPDARAELRLVVNAGSILEDDDQRGMAHVVEHMAFNGTRSFGREEIVGYFESIGMRFGPDVNAYTSFDETVYMLTLPTDSAGVLETGVRMLEEWAWGIAFDSVQIEQERAVVIEEWRLGRGAGSRVQYQQFPTLAQRSRYAERLPIGTRESLETFDQEALIRFYEDWYRPDLMAVVAVGDFDADEVEAMIREHMSRVPPRPDPRPRRVYDVPSHRETLISVATDPELTSGSVSLYLKRRPRIWEDTDDFRHWIARSLTASMLVNRLSELTQVADAPFLDVSSFQGRFVRRLSTFALTVRTPEDGTEAGLHNLLMEVQRAARFGFTSTELEREKREMMRNMEQRYAERDRTTSGSYAADYVAYFLYGGTVLTTERQYELYREMIPQIERREVHRIVQDWTATPDRVLLVSIPEEDDVEPPNEQLLQHIVELSHFQRIAPYRDSLSGAPLVRDLPETGEIVAETRIPEVGVLVWELGNGSTIVLKPTDFRQDEILFAGRSPGGTSLFSDEDYIPALTAAAVVQSGGLGELSSNDLRKRLAGRVAGVGADIGDVYEGISGAASARDLELLFQLVYLKFTAPRVDSAAFLAYQSQARSSVSNRSASPDLAFQDTLRITLAQDHPRAQPPSVEMFDQLDMHRSFEIYRDRFADASDFTFYMVGSFDPEEIRPLVRRYLASLPDLGREEEGRDVGIRPPRGVVEKTVYRGIEPRSATQIVFTGGFEFTRDNVIALQSLSDALRMRLRERLREQLGGTYGVEVRVSASRQPIEQYQLSVGFGSDPGRVDELVDAVFEDIADLQARGPTGEDLARVREIQFRTRETNLRQNHFWLTQLMTYKQHDWDLAEIPAAATRASALNSAVIQQAAARYLDSGNYVQVSLLPTSAAASGTDVGGTELPD
ncbi:MAG: insulinase family protein [Gemmatimonadota bacterium]